MVLRGPLRCISCKSIVITRTQIGHSERQEHSFPCPKCGVTITYSIDIDQKRGKTKFRKPVNAQWSKSERGAVATLTFSDEIPVPVDMGGMFSPFLATFWNIEDPDKYRHDETLRQMFVRQEFSYIQRCAVHFERKAWDLFDKESPSRSQEPQTIVGRLIDLYNAYGAGFLSFTPNSRGNRARVRQRIILAKLIEIGLFRDLTRDLLGSGKIRNLWREIARVRSSFVNVYSALQPLLQMRYWRKELQDIGKFSISVKKFDELRQLYIDMFETLFRLLELAIGVETIIHHRELMIPTKKGKMSLDQFSALPNAAKLPHFCSYPIEDLFSTVLDTQFRNSIGHNAAHYDPESDTVVTCDPRTLGKEQRISYTEFCDKVLLLFAVFELAVIYHHTIHIFVNGRFD